MLQKKSIVLMKNSNPTMVFDENITCYVFPKSWWEALKLQKSK